jgi:hypothetical protein
MFASMPRRIYEAKEKIALALGLPIVIVILFVFLLALWFSLYCNLFGSKQEQGFCPKCGQRIATHDDRACDFRSGNQPE